MAKPKVPKLRLSFLSSFRICRPKKPSSMVRSPLPPVTSMFSPVNCKSYDISFPSFSDTPPSKPSKSITPSESTSHVLANSYEEKVFNSPVSSKCDETTLLITPPRNDKRNSACAAKKSRALSISSYGSDEDDDCLFSSSTSFDSSYNHSNQSFKAGKKPAKQTSLTPQRFKHYGSNEWKHGDEYHGKKASISSRLVPCMRDAKVNESFVVVKKSVDPYRDFKKSMIEMIVEKQIFEPKELEHLLMSFLSLNSNIHHKVIIQAFTEIMNSVLC